MIQKVVNDYNCYWDYWISEDIKGDNLVLLNEDKIILYNINGKSEYIPDKKFYFRTARFISDGTDVKLVILSNKYPNQYLSKIILKEI